MLHDDAAAGEYDAGTTKADLSVQSGELITATPKAFHELTPGMNAMHNFNVQGAESWRLMAAATGGGSQKIGDNLGKTINLRYWFVHKIELTNPKNGEITEATRVVLFDKDGTAYSSVSESILNGLETIIQAFGPGPYEDNVMFKVETARTRSGMNIYNIIPLS